MIHELNTEVSKFASYESKYKVLNSITTECCDPVISRALYKRARKLYKKVKKECKEFKRSYFYSILGESYYRDLPCSLENIINTPGSVLSKENISLTGMGIASYGDKISAVHRSHQEVLQKLRHKIKEKEDTTKTLAKRDKKINKIKTLLSAKDDIIKELEVEAEKWKADFFKLRREVKRGKNDIDELFKENLQIEQENQRYFSFSNPFLSHY
ncbi:unnamed protein product [Moneuplotes crassus]|uniref:Uncharacterized protein n=1 Tax=Euplotes crassus TaxID=5936 RepID=A0AAD2D572_EUPCR|nr:unnamed protein product [Moneuplotes crassus]